MLILALLAALPLEPAGSAYADAKGVALRSPEGVACTDSGTVVAADTGNGRLVTFRFQGGALAPGAEVRAPELGFPTRLQIDSKGNVLSLDGRGRRIVRIGAGGGFAGFVEPSGIPQASGFFPVAFKLDAADRIWVLDALSRRVVALDPAGKFVRQLALPAGGSFTDVAVDSRGGLFVADGVKGAIWTLQGDKFTPLTRSLPDVLSFASYLAVSAQGPLVVVDSHGNGLVALGRDGTFLGRRLSIGWNEGSIYYPGQICIDSRGDVFVADRGNHRIQAFTPGK